MTVSCAGTCISLGDVCVRTSFSCVIASRWWCSPALGFGHGDERASRVAAWTSFSPSSRCSTIRMGITSRSCTEGDFTASSGSVTPLWASGDHSWTCPCLQGSNTTSRPRTQARICPCSSHSAFGVSDEGVTVGVFVAGFSRSSLTWTRISWVREEGKNDTCSKSTGWIVQHLPRHRGRALRPAHRDR